MPVALLDELGDVLAEAQCSLRPSVCASSTPAEDVTDGPCPLDDIGWKHGRYIRMVYAALWWQVRKSNNLSKECYWRLPNGLWIANIGKQNLFSFCFKLDQNNVGKQLKKDSNKTNK
jgi:hypothetical protein